MISRRVLLALALCAAAAGCKRDAPSGGAPLKIAAAADLTSAFTEVGAAFEKKTGQKTTFSFGSTGLLAKQIAEGAPFDLFAAANVSFVDDLVKQSAVLADTKTMYAQGRIVVWAKGAKAPALADLAGASFTKIAIANPEHAPYGKAAQQAMMKLGIWDAVKPRIVYGENVQQTLQFAETGNVDAAVVALAIALGAKDGAFTPVDPKLHDPIDQAMVVCARSEHVAQAKAFAAFVAGEEGRAIMKRYGFVLPGD